MTEWSPSREPGWPANPAEHRVVVVGASPNPERYSNRAVRLLKEKGYAVIPVHPRETAIEGLPAVPNLAAIAGPVHTLSLYVGAKRSQALTEAILALQPGRVIFNPGSESPVLEGRLRQQGILPILGCTLVMLHSQQF